MEVGHAYASREPGNLGVVPLNGKRDRSAAQHAEVVGVVRVLPDVFAGEDHILSKRLLQAGVKLVAPARSEWSGHAWRHAAQQRSQDERIASRAGQHQVFVERSFEHPGIGHAKNSVGLLHVVGHAQARLGFFVRCQPVVEVAAQAEVERPASLGDGVLQVERELFDVAMSAEAE